MSFGEKPLNESVEEPRVVSQRLRAAIARAEDKPAATGSGEPSESERDLAAARQNVLYIVNNAIGYIPDGFIDALAHYVEKVEKHYHPKPTPPASQPTVTLDRETFDNVVSKLKIVERCTPDREGKDLVLDALALLRAAEQKS